MTREGAERWDPSTASEYLDDSRLRARNLRALGQASGARGGGGRRGEGEGNLTKEKVKLRPSGDNMDAAAAASWSAARRYRSRTTGTASVTPVVWGLRRQRLRSDDEADGRKKKEAEDAADGGADAKGPKPGGKAGRAGPGAKGGKPDLKALERERDQKINSELGSLHKMMKEKYGDKVDVAFGEGKGGGEGGGGGKRAGEEEDGVGGGGGRKKRMKL